MTIAEMGHRVIQVKFWTGSVFQTRPDPVTQFRPGDAKGKGLFKILNSPVKQMHLALD